MKQPLRWTHCYEKSLSGFIVPEAFGHPAKLSLALTERIFDHMIAQGWLAPGDLVGDCFGGVAVGGLVAAYRKLNWIGVELEPRFVLWGNQNIELHRSKLNNLGAPVPQLIQGDSRKFSQLIAAHLAGVVSSPPYAQSLRGLNYNQIDASKLDPTKHHTGKNSQLHLKASYGKEPGQIERLPEGTIKACVTSPPYATISAGAGGLNHKPAKAAGQQSGRAKDSASQSADQKYGNSEGQIAQLVGDVTSPPWESNCEGGVRKGKLKRAPTEGKGNYASPEARAAQLDRDAEKTYGETEGNIGNTRQETYWDAMHLVYSELYAALRHGGVAAIVVKDYCKDRQIVPLCDDTAKLLKHVGFRIVQRAHAMLVNETKEADLFTGETVTRRERKSFFRRLYEKAGGPKIDFEQVIFAQR